MSTDDIHAESPRTSEPCTKSYGSIPTSRGPVQIDLLRAFYATLFRRLAEL